MKREAKTKFISILLSIHDHLPAHLLKFARRIYFFLRIGIEEMFLKSLKISRIDSKSLQVVSVLDDDFPNPYILKLIADLINLLTNIYLFRSCSRSKIESIQKANNK